MDNVYFSIWNKFGVQYGQSLLSNTERGGRGERERERESITGQNSRCRSKAERKI
jgi:hypothetical protein